jgi:hypothetical protein
MKIVVNRCFGGFGISKEAAEFMANKGCEQAKKELEAPEFYGYGYSKDYPDEYLRTNPFLVEAVETLGEKANGVCANLMIVEIPDDIMWFIDDYDGHETIHEEHRSW